MINLDNYSEVRESCFMSFRDCDVFLKTCSSDEVAAVRYGFNKGFIDGMLFFSTLVANNMMKSRQDLEAGNDK